MNSTPKASIAAFQLFKAACGDRSAGQESPHHSMRFDPLRLCYLNLSFNSHCMHDRVESNRIESYMWLCCANAISLGVILHAVEN